MAMRALTRYRADPVDDRYHGGSKQHDRDRHQGELPAGNGAGQGSVDPCRIRQRRVLVPAGEGSAATGAGCIGNAAG
jgi:hypothetical protein